ncbi:MAG TPA: hypothetical protein VHV78_01480 [Gemmatimonadaceae bacterium]|nr:hypothetical protein [Gemmatimonadaceae bacterium]
MSDAAAATESTSLADSAAAAERAPRDRAVHSVIDMPLQLDVSQRSLVRREVEREARGRVAADPRAKSAAAQSIEVRVDHVTVRLDAPRTTPAPAPSAAAASVGGGAFGAFYFARSLR